MKLSNKIVYLPILLISVVVPLYLFAPHFNIFWLAMGCLGLLLMTAAAIKYPACMIVPVIYFPQWKSHPIFVPLEKKIDLTLIALVVLSLILLFHLVAMLYRGWSIRSLMAGQGPGIVAFFVFATIVALSYTYTPSPTVGLTSVLRVWGIGGLLFLTPFVLIRSERDFRLFALTFVVFAVVQSFITTFDPEYGKGGKFENVIRTDIGAGWFIGMALLLVLYFQLADSQRTQWAIRLITVPVYIVGIVAATARGPIVSLLLIFLIRSVLPAKNTRLLYRIITGPGVLVLVVIVGFLAFSNLPGTADRYKEKTDEMVAMLHGTEPTGTAGLRWEYYQAALKEIPERPLFGLGVGGWGSYYKGKDKLEYPHNLLLLIAAEEGVIGLVAFLAFLTSVAFAIRRIFWATSDRLVVLGGLVFFCVSVSMFSGDLDSNRLLWFWSGMSFAFARMMPQNRAGSLRGYIRAPRFVPEGSSELWSE